MAAVNRSLPPSTAFHDAAPGHGGAATMAAHWARAITGAGSDVERRVAINELAKLLRAACARGLAADASMAQVADDAINEAVMRVLALVAEGRPIDNLLAYAFTTARNGARDLLRRRNGAREVTLDDDGHLTVGSIEDEVILLEESLEATARCARVRNALAALDHHTRMLLEDVYLRAVPIGAIARRDAANAMRARPDSPSASDAPVSPDAACLVRARNRTDKRLQRAREKLLGVVGQKLAQPPSSR